MGRGDDGRLFTNCNNWLFGSNSSAIIIFNTNFHELVINFNHEIDEKYKCPLLFVHLWVIISVKLYGESMFYAIRRTITFGVLQIISLLICVFLMLWYGNKQNRLIACLCDLSAIRKSERKSIFLLASFTIFHNFAHPKKYDNYGEHRIY